MRPISTELRFLFWCSCMASVCMSSYSQWTIQRKPATLVRIFDMFQQVGDCYSVKEIRINCTAIIEITDTDTRRPNNNYRVVYTTCSYYVCGKRHPLVNDPLWIEPLPNSPLECNNGGYVRYATGDESLSCICPKNFKGRFCEIPVCRNGCYNGGTCVQHYVSTKCLCPDGFVGEFCETELKLKSCNLTNKSYMGTPVALTMCENQYDCKICETCCRVEDKNVCVQQNTSKQVCIYFGKVYFAGDEFSTTDGKNCTCIPQTLKFGFVRCSNITNTNAVENKEPLITNCPTNTVIVSLDANRNIGTIRNDFIAKDWQDKRLSVQLSTPYVKSCRCHDNKQNKFVIEATTAKDENGQRGRCEFVVETQDETPPSFTHCPSTIYALSDELVSWPDPVAIDNVGVRTLAQLTSYKKKSRFERGEYLISYIAYDWQGNNSKCQFFVIIGDGLDNRDQFSL